MNTNKVGAVILLLIGGVTVWSFLNPPIAKWVVLVFAILQFLTFLTIKENK